MSSVIANQPPGLLEDAPAGGAGTATIPAHPAATPPGLITGRVRLPDGAPLPGARLTIIDSAGRQAATARADAEGHYTASVPEPGTYLLIGTHPPYQPAAARARVADTGAGCDLVLSGMAGLTGQVRDAGSGVPLPEAVLILTDDRGTLTARTSSDTQGHYHLAELPAGTYTLTAWHGEHDPAATGIALPAGDTLTRDMTLRPPVVLTGTVRSAATGAPLPETQLTVLDPAGHLVAHTRTDRKGRFRVENLHAETYAIIAAGYPPAGVIHTARPDEAPIQIALGSETPIADRSGPTTHEVIR
jgi:uncharacterized protein YfaS (alpha-2-macroglobulin family)